MIYSQTVLYRNDTRRGLKKPERAGFFYLKVPIFLTILALLFNVVMPIDLAWALKTDTMPSPIGEEKSVDPGQVSFLAPSDITIPPLYGMIKETFQQDRDPKGLIIYMQDLHTHYQAHKNIAGIIKHIVDKYNINVVLSEAKATDKGFAYIRPWIEKGARERIAEENLRKGIITGWEALDLTSDLDLVLQGRRCVSQC